MKDGTCIYYAIQSHMVASSPWGKPDEPLATEKASWFDCGGFFAKIFEPWNVCPMEPKFPDSHAEMSAIHIAIGQYGWTQLKYAVLAKKRAERASESGKLNTFSPHGNVVQAHRYAFRIIRRTVSQVTEILPPMQTSDK